MAGLTSGVPMPRVELRLLDEANLSELLDAAVADADPADVMPPVSGPPGWTEDRRRAFCDFHRSRSIATAEPAESTYVITLDDRVIGAARLQPSGGSVEMGIWIGRSHRGRGIGRLVAAELLTLAQQTDATRIVASTTSHNTAAQQLLRGIGATLTPTGDAVDAVVETHRPHGGRSSTIVRPAAASSVGSRPMPAGVIRLSAETHLR